MAAYALLPVSFDGNALNDSNYVSWFERADNVMGTVVAQAVDVDRPFNSPKTVGIQKQGKAYPLHIRLVSGVDETKLNTLKQWFASSQTQKYLKVTNGAGTTLRVACVSRGLLATDNAVEWIANLWADDGTLEADSASTDTHAAVSGNSHDLSHTNNGATNSYPKITIRPRAVKNSTLSPVWCQFRNFATQCAFPLTDPNGDGWPLMVIDAWNTAALVTAGKAQADGDDCRVYVDGVEVKRWFGTGAYAWNQATTKVWINVPFPSLCQATLKANTSAGGTEDIESYEADGFALWPASGYVQTGDASGEVMWYGSHTLTVLSGIKRAQKGTTAAIHGAGGMLYRLPHDIRLTYGASALAAPYAPSNNKPIFDLALSTNTLRTWPTAYYAPGTRRTGQWVPFKKLLNALSTLLRVFEGSSKMNVEDSPPEAGKDEGAGWYFPCPPGVTAFTHDVAVPSNMLLNVYGSDGVADKLLATYNPDTDGDDKTVTPAATVDGVRYEGMVRTVTAAEPGTAGNGTLGTESNEIAQGFTLDQVSTIYGFVFKLKKTAGADGNVVFNLYKGGTADHPDSGDLLLSDTIVAAAADITTAWADYSKLLATPITLPAGADYYITMYRDAAAAAIYWAYDTSCYARGTQYTEAADTWTKHSDRTMWFRILGDGTICQPEVPTGSGNEVTIDNPRLTLSNVWGTIPAGAETPCCLTDATITNGAQVLAVKLPMLIDESLVIDCKAKTAILTGNGESVAYAVTWPDGGEFYLAPGANTITYAELGMTNTDLTLEVRDAWP